MTTHRDIAGSQQALRPGFAAGLALEAAALRRFNAAGYPLREGACDRWLRFTDRWPRIFAGQTHGR